MPLGVESVSVALANPFCVAICRVHERQMPSGFFPLLKPAKSERLPFHYTTCRSLGPTQICRMDFSRGCYVSIVANNALNVNS